MIPARPDGRVIAPVVPDQHGGLAGNLPQLEPAVRHMEIRIGLLFHAAGPDRELRHPLPGEGQVGAAGFQLQVLAEEGCHRMPSFSTAFHLRG